MGKKPIVSATYGNEKFQLKNSLPYLNCVVRLSCVVPYKEKTGYITTHKSAVNRPMDHTGET